MTTGSWTHTSTGVTESAAFIPSTLGLVLVHSHQPAAPARPPVVICSSVYEELRTNYRREVLLARRLAANGVPVARFEYRGFGNSDDAPGAGPTFDSLRADLAAVTAYAEAFSPGPVTTVGYRFGALLAAADGASGDLVLWEPAQAGREYLREMSRASHIAQVRSTPDAAPETASGHELLGWSVSDATYQSFAGVTYPADLAPGRRTLCVYVSRTPTLRGPIQVALDQWTAAGYDVERVHIAARRDPWFVPEQWEPQETEADTLAVVEAITSWVVAP